MPFFQNPFDVEFRGSLLLADRQHIPTFNVGPNRNRSDLMVAWVNEPYDLSTDTTLTIHFALDPEFKNFAAIAVNVAAGAVSSSAVKAAEVVANLNANSMFRGIFTAEIHMNGTNRTILIKSKRDRLFLRTYIANTGAEKHLKFNKYAGVAELPTYFERHTIANARVFSDSQALLVLLDEGDSVDQQVITNAGLDYTTVQEDYQLLRGRSGMFNFSKITVDENDRITQIIEYPAGAIEGDFGRKTVYDYDGTNTKPSSILELPYTIEGGDLLTP